MSYKVEATPNFEREAKPLGKKYKSFQQDLNSLLDQLELTPLMGTPMGQDCYKIRMAISSKGKGKSGGARVITLVRIVKKTVFLVSIYDKSDQADIADKELKSLIGQIPK